MIRISEKCEIGLKVNGETRLVVVRPAGYPPFMLFVRGLGSPARNPDAENGDCGRMHCASGWLGPQKSCLMLAV